MERPDKKGTNVPGERTRRLIFRHEKTPVLAYRSFFTQILKKGDV